MHIAAILKVKGRNVVTTTADKSLLDIAKLLAQRGWRISLFILKHDNFNQLDGP
jgi:hypothetical protein